MPEINWDRIRDVSDVILPVPFADSDQDGNPGEGEWLGYVAHGARVQDREGNRFLVMGHGSVQGTVILRDRYRRMFHADVDQRLKVIG